MSEAMEIDGACHCGAVTYAAHVDPEKTVICHCTDCQTLSGTAFRVVVPAEEGSFRLLSGELRIYVKTAESGNSRAQAFCPNCGTPIYSGPPGPATGVVSLRVGAIRQRDRLIPSDQYWFRSAQTWLETLPALSRREKQPVFDPKGGFGD